MINLLNDEVRPVHSAPNPVGCTARQFAAAENNRMLAEKVINPATTKRAAIIVFDFRKGGLMRFCIECRKLTAGMIRDFYSSLGVDE